MAERFINGRAVKDLIAQMTLEEKASLCDGENFWHTKAIDRLGIPSVMVCDGPHGLRKQDLSAKGMGLARSVPSVCFPTASLTACTWNPDLIYEMGQALGDKCLSQRVSVLLGPGVNMKRSPLCGRNFEYFSEDPYLAGEMGASFVAGVQSRGVGTSVKHFAVNNQETRRMTVSAVVDERAMREVYLPAFENTVKKAQPWTVMNAYNRLNGIYCSENEWLQISVLRDEWGFEGLVVSDWGAVNNRARGLKNGNDLEMPSSNGLGMRKIIDAVKNGDVPEQVLDARVENILNLVAKAMPALETAHAVDEGAQHELARRIAGEGMVLLKNEDEVLPLKDPGRMLVIGEFAKRPRYQGAGSSLINPTGLSCAYDALIDAGYLFDYADGYARTSRKAALSSKLRAQAVEKARDADTVIIFAGLTEDFESEGFDRSHIDLPPEHNELIEAVLRVNKNVIVVLSAGAPMAMPWFDRVKGVLLGYLAGQAGGDATADIISGRVNPSGKLAETFPFENTSNPSAPNFPGDRATVEYRESIYIGYRYYDKAGVPVRLPFGFGLSYTRFEYSDIKLSRRKMKDSDELVVKFKIKNTGELAGAETAQLYVRDVESTAFRPDKELKGFVKVRLEPGEEKEVSLSLSKRAFAYYNTNLHDWHVESGRFEILVGASSADMRLSAYVDVASTQEAEIPDHRQSAPSYYTGRVAHVEAREFEAVLGRELPPSRRDATEPLTLENNFEDGMDSRWGGRFYRGISRITGLLLGDSGMMQSIPLQTPFKSFVAMSGGLFSEKMADGLLLILNDEDPGKGFRQLLSGIPNIVRNLKAFLKTV